MRVLSGVMLVGLAASGKSSVLHSLDDALTKLHQDRTHGADYRKVRIHTLNLKSVTMDELYGFVNRATLESKNGLMGLAVRLAVNVVEEELECSSHGVRTGASFASDCFTLWNGLRRPGGALAP